MNAANEAVLGAVGAAEAAVNAYLRQDPEALARLGRLAGSVIAVELVSAARDDVPAELLARVFLLPGPDGMALLIDYAGSPDTTLRGTPGALARLGLGGEGFGSVFTGEVQIEGDLELGQRFKRAMDAMRFDWEEALSRVLGDAAAHRVGHLARDLSRWTDYARDELGRNTGEYLQEELRALPTRAELDVWLRGVDVARDDCARLEARIARLRERLERGPGRGEAPDK